MTKHNVRIVTSTALFDGHDASINIIRRMLQEFGAEVIHLGHNRSVQDVVKSVLQEGAQGVCISSYQGGHMEYFKYLRQALDLAGASFVQIYGGGGGVIIHEEKKELEASGIAQIFHPDDGRRLGLEGMIKMIVDGCDFDVLAAANKTSLKLHKNEGDTIPSYNLGVALNQIELNSDLNQSEIFKNTNLESFKRKGSSPVVLGITGTGGAGKSSLIDELAQRFLNAFPEKNIAIVCVDPSKKKTGGALLGDRIRMNSLSRNHIFMRSLASRGSGKEISTALPQMLNFLKQCDFDFIIAETSGIGQGNMAITEVSDLSMYVMTSDFGAQSQLEKIDMIDFADFVAVNKADRRGALDAVRDVTKQYKRSRKIFDNDVEVPVFLTQASQFNDKGVNQLFFALADKLHAMDRLSQVTQEFKQAVLSAEEHVIIPSDRQVYLAEIVSTMKSYKQRVSRLAESASRLGSLLKIKPDIKLSESQFNDLEKNYSDGLTSKELSELTNWNQFIQNYSGDELVYSVRGKEFRQPMVTTSLSGTKIRKISLPNLNDWGDRFKYLKLENVPGEFPFTAGVFPLKRTDEDPKRMFAGEGTPERTNLRFHYLCKGETAHRLSTAFDSVTLYGQDPNLRPDIYGKIGESGVSICTLNDMKKLFKGFDLISPNTSVSMTINGPAPIILAFYFNTAIDAQIEIFEKKENRKATQSELETIRKTTLKQIRGTVQADILKEDQGQNTCIFSTNFALKMMGDTQEYFTTNDIKNFYSVSISGYHIAEAGANPISQLAFTLSNGFTFVEYYLSRGLKIDDFAPNLSFFFSNGLDPEYSVLGRVARRIWAVAMRDLYKANDRSQKLKYHIQTSGRSLHAQEIDFNDIRTTLQALLALNDNCNSLHTNAYDEAITTPTEESVRRAMAIQMIINREFGISKNENINQGSYFLEELTDIVEEAVLAEFKKISDRGGVLGAMETQYQRSKIQEESMYY
ncbi:MAG: cobalamin B12-binding domain-containing protein, partial [Moraxellaceae bacterium]|nr:cobalamin B12-binding domain-containing protein [Pseudobdellovibrionaceae bacterium]